MPTVAELKRAHSLYEQNEPRDVFYRVAIELLDMARTEKTAITPPEALSVLLQSWNARYYVSQHHGRFPREHFKGLEKLLNRQPSTRSRLIDRARSRGWLPKTRRRSRPCSPTSRRSSVPLARRRHCICSRRDSSDSGIGTSPSTTAADSGVRARTHSRHWRFMEFSRDDCVALGGEAKRGTDLLKQLDEFNFCLARGWL